MSQATQAALLKQLKDPFDPKFVKWRIGQVTKDGKKASALAYLDAREVYKRLDDVCGIGGWQDKLIEINGGFVCELSIKIDGEWITKSDSADFTDIESIKGGASSALKRAAAVWGIGRYLYYLPNVWATVNVLYTKKNGDPVYGLAEQPELPEWAMPNTDIERWEDVAELELAAQEELIDDTSDVDIKKQQKLAELKKGKA